MIGKLKSAMGLYLGALRDGEPEKAVKEFVGNRLIQHSTGVADGPEAFVAHCRNYTDMYPLRDIRILRSLVDGNFVFLHVLQSLNNGMTKFITMDFFETDQDDKVIEHWDVIKPYEGYTPSGHTVLDGEVEVKDWDKTAANKEVVRGLVRDVLCGENPKRIEDYISAEKYIQHNVSVKDGLRHFKQLIFADNCPLVYDSLVLLVGEGNFVAILCEVFWEGKPFAQIDLFRLEDGKIVEHWDNAEALVPDTVRVNVGKF